MFDETMKYFCNSYCLKSLIKQPTCFKNLENPSCIDLILTNKSQSFHNSCVIETGLSSDFYRMTVSIIKMDFSKLPPKAISYCNSKKFGNERCMDSLYLALLNSQIDCTKNRDLFFDSFSTSVPLMDKPGSCFLLAKCLKNTCGRVTF